MTRKVRRVGAIAAYALLISLVAWQGTALATCPITCSDFGGSCGNSSCTYSVKVGTTAWCCNPGTTNRCCSYANETWDCYTNNTAQANLCTTWQYYNDGMLDAGSCSPYEVCQ